MCLKLRVVFSMRCRRCSGTGSSGGCADSRSRRLADTRARSAACEDVPLHLAREVGRARLQPRGYRPAKGRVASDWRYGETGTVWQVSDGGTFLEPWGLLRVGGGWTEVVGTHNRPGQQRPSSSGFLVQLVFVEFV